MKKVVDEKSREKNNKLISFATIILMTLIGFFIGKTDFSKPEIEIIETEIKPEIAKVVLQKRTGDKIFAEITGEVKIIWADNYSLEESGEIIWSQIPTEDDLELDSFKYLGNAKTNNFYPANSYPARGTEVRYRRFFETKENALSAGFKASKLVK